ncbi:MAG: hypothetical protein C4560_09920 [Nitrospiraceae bacterium]|nr:MAG: hypothetical protein C4560_09920 [Nitrospiraceae bacterium]
MSFILDALKKLEQKRQRDAVPNLMTVHVPEQEEQKRRPMWQYLLLAAMVLNAGVFTAWLRPWEAKEQNTAIHSEAMPNTAIPKSSIGEKTPSPGTSKERQAETKVQEPAQVEEKPSEDTTTPPETKSGDPKRSSSVKTSKQPPAEDIKSAPAAGQSDTPDAVATNDIPELNRLPAALQGEIPGISILGHVYSNSPNTRMVNINGDLFREGDNITDNLKIEEIVETGVILNYKGTKFRLNAF